MTPVRAILAGVVCGLLLASPAWAAEPRISARDCRSTAKMIYAMPARAEGARLVITRCIPHLRRARRCVVRYGSTRVELVVRYAGPADVIAFARPLR